MSVAAIICEYNPFHRGHAYQIELIRQRLGEDTVILSLMSGSTVQRGEIAVASKYQRAAAAIKMGADLVLELPYPICCSVADHFAYGAVSILHSLGIVDHLVFGSECNDISLLYQHAKRRNSESFTKMLQVRRQQHPSLSYPQLVDLCYNEMYGESFPKGSNDILGVFYVSALMALGSKMKPITHKRLPGASATEARGKMRMGDLSGIPEEVREDFLAPASMDIAERAILFALRSGKDKMLAKLSLEASTLSELTEMLMQKNYTKARIRRDLLQAVIGHDESNTAFEARFTTVLAMNERGAGVLYDAKKRSKIPIITKPSDYRKYDGIKYAFELNLAADRLFSLCTKTPLSANWSLRETPFVKK